MRVVLDTNVLLSGILFLGLPRNLIERALHGDIDVVTSPPLLAELEELLGRKFDFSPEVAAAVRSELETLADVVEPGHVPRVVRDPDDDQVLAAAVAGRAECIVTGDRDLLSLQAYSGLTILTPAAFVERLGSG